MLEMLGIAAAVRLVVERYYGNTGLWVYEAFDYLNRELFAGELPQPLIVWALTPHGCTLGRVRVAKDRLPVLTLHPSLFGGSERSGPWGIPPRWLGPRFAYDVLIHELIHLSVEFRLGGWEGVGGETIHNNPLWVGEVNRLAPLLGFDNVQAGLKKVQRVPIDGPLTKRGKRPTKPARVDSGNIPFAALAGFPWQLRVYLRQAESYYGQPEPAFPASVATPEIAPW
jgi:hypothetical protein